MGANRAYWTWGLLLVGLLGFGTAFLGTWYEVASDPPQFSFNAPGVPNQGSQVEPARWLLHTDMWHPLHFMEEGGAGDPAGYEDVPRLAQVLDLSRTFFLIGLVGALVATVGLLFRVRGLVDGKGLLASVAVVSVLFLGFGVVYFAANIADAYNEELDENWGSSPEVAFVTFGTDTEDGTWRNATSAPRAGWMGGALGTAAFTAAFGFVFATELRGAREVLTDDEAAAAAYERQTAERAHVLDRIRAGGQR